MRVFISILWHMVCRLSNPAAKHLKTSARFDFFKFDYEHANKSRAPVVPTELRENRVAWIDQEPAGRAQQKDPADRHNRGIPVAVVGQ